MKCSAESEAIVTIDRFYLSFASANAAYFFYLMFFFPKWKGMKSFLLPLDSVMALNVSGS